MFRILVPVDFYKTSFSAFRYASNFSKLFPGSEITLLHVINGSFGTNDVMVHHELLDRKDSVLKRLQYFEKEYPLEIGVEIPKVKINRVTKYGIPGFTIAEYAKSENFDMIIMGTRDKHNLFDKLLGSSSSITIRTAECPVMLIHENVKYNSPKKIVFGFDSTSDIEGAIEQYRKLNNIILAKTDFVHVNTFSKDNIEHQKKEIIEELFEDHNPNFLFEVKTIEGSEMRTTLKDYCLFEKSDMLVMMHRDQGLISNMFRSHQSVKMAQEFHLPVLVLQENN